MRDTVQHASPFRLQEAQVVSLLTVEEPILHQMSDAEARDSASGGSLQGEAGDFANTVHTQPPETFNVFTT